MKRNQIFSTFALAMLLVCTVVMYSCSKSSDRIAPSKTDKITEVKMLSKAPASKDKAPCTATYIHYTRIIENGKVIGFENCWTATSFCGEESFKWWDRHEVNCADYKLH